MPTRLVPFDTRPARGRHRARRHPLALVRRAFTVAALTGALVGGVAATADAATTATSSSSDGTAPLAPGSGNHPELQEGSIVECGPGAHPDTDGSTCITNWHPATDDSGTAAMFATGGEVALFAAVLVLMF